MVYRWVKSIIEKISDIYISPKSNNEVYPIPFEEAKVRLQEFFDEKQTFWSEVDIRGEFISNNSFIVTLKSQRTPSILQGTLSSNSYLSTTISFKTKLPFHISLFSTLITLFFSILLVKSILAENWKATLYSISFIIISSFILLRISEAAKYVLDDRYYRYIHNLMSLPSEPKKVNLDIQGL